MAKPTTDGYNIINIRVWDREGLLQEGTRNIRWP
jgi:hypothetical protein